MTFNQDVDSHSKEPASVWFMCGESVGSQWGVSGESVSGESVGSHWGVSQWGVSGESVGSHY